MFARGRRRTGLDGRYFADCRFSTPPRSLPSYCPGTRGGVAHLRRIEEQTDRRETWNYRRNGEGSLDAYLRKDRPQGPFRSGYTWAKSSRTSNFRGIACRGRQFSAGHHFSAGALKIASNGVDLKLVSSSRFPAAESSR